MIKMFKWKRFKSHSGKILNWKIECDDLSTDDVRTIARMILSKYSFKEVLCPPTKSRNINLLRDMLDPKSHPDGKYDSLLIDDVLTTGRSMKELKSLVKKDGAKNVIGIVIFARNKPPSWITPIFTLNNTFNL